jgi:murein L,D-transpeptidase YafK
VWHVAVAAVPEGIVSLGNSDSATALVVDKEHQTLDVYRRQGGKIQRVLQVPALTGKEKGPKVIPGDLRTPEGIYWMVDFVSRKVLNQRYGTAVAAEYGVGAFVLDFPNRLDRWLKRRGDGIWIHGRDESKMQVLAPVTRGCVVAANNHLISLASFIYLNQTPVLIYDQVPQVSEEIQAEREKSIVTWLNQWKDAWESRGMEAYMRFYDPDRFRGDGMNAREWRAYKGRLFNAYKHIQLTLSDIRIFHYRYQDQEYSYVTFHQQYRSDQYQDVGYKRLLLSRVRDVLQIGEERFLEETDVGETVALQQGASGSEEMP